MTKLKVTIGTFKTTEALVKAVEKDHKISDWAKELLPKIQVEKKKRVLDLEIKTVAELGFPNGTTTKELFAKIKEIGELCPPETALQLRLQYKDQPLGEWLIVVMEPIADADGYLYVLDVERYSNGSWVDGFYARSDDVWDGDCPLVFCLKSLATRKLEPSLPLAVPEFSTQPTSQDFQELTKEIKRLNDKLEKVLRSKRVSKGGK